MYLVLLNSAWRKEQRNTGAVVAAGTAGWAHQKDEKRVIFVDINLVTTGCSSPGAYW